MTVEPEENVLLYLRSQCVCVCVVGAVSGSSREGALFRSDNH